MHSLSQNGMHMGFEGGRGVPTDTRLMQRPGDAAARCSAGAQDLARRNDPRGAKDSDRKGAGARAPGPDSGPTSPPTLILVHFTMYLVALNRLVARIYHEDSLVCSTHVVILAHHLGQHPGCHRNKTWVDAGDACINLRLLGR